MPARAAAHLVDALQFRHAVDKRRDLAAELLGDVLDGVFGVLGNVVEQSRRHALRVHAQVANRRRGNGQRRRREHVHSRECRVNRPASRSRRRSART